jgi:hypothetical protein
MDYFYKSNVSCENCNKCGSTTHTTEVHIARRLTFYNVDVTPDVICTKCLRNNHPRKYCEIYNSCVKDHDDHNSYLNYLDKITEISKEEIITNNIINSESYQSNLKIFNQYSLEHQLDILIENSHRPHKVLKPLWDIVYKQHSKEEIDSIMNILSY